MAKWLIAVGGLLALVAVGAAVAFFRFLNSPDSSSEPIMTRYMHALGGEEVLFVENRWMVNGAEDTVMRRMRLASGNLVEVWSSESMPRHTNEWTRVGEYMVGVEPTPEGAQDTKLVVIALADGRLVGRAPVNLYRQWLALDDHTIVLRNSTGLVQYALNVEPFAATWTASIPDVQVVASLGATPSAVLTMDGTLWIRARGDGSEVAMPAFNFDRIVGVSSTRNELLAVEGGQMVARPLGMGDPRVLTGLPTPLATTLDVPCLYGEHSGKWIVVYPLGQTQSFSMNGRAWTVPPDVEIAAIDPASGSVLWRTGLGGFDLTCRELFDNTMPNDDQRLPRELVIRGYRDVNEGASIDGHLVSIDLETGAILWQARIPNDSRSAPNLFRRGVASYVVLHGADSAETKHALLRFERARMTGAVFLADYGFSLSHTGAVTETGAWFDLYDEDGAEQWVRVEGPQLTTVAGEAGVTAEDATAWATERASLPAEALTQR